MVNVIRITWMLGKALNRLYWDQDRLLKYQEKKLRSVVNNAYHNVQFYHDKFKANNIHPSDIKTIKDLDKLPIITKKDLKSQETERLIATGYDITTLKKGRTSGSTGNPLHLYFNNQEDEWRKTIYMRANVSCGQRPRDSWVFVSSPHHFGDTTGIQRKLGIFAQKVVSVFTDVEDQIAYVRKEKPDILDGYSSALVHLAKEVKRKDITDINPRIMFGTADFIDKTSQKLMEDVFGAPFLDQYGCSEIDRSAWKCPEKTGYHMDVDSVITQFVDDEGEQVALGEQGEVIFTSLFNHTMPFIRYAVGDMGIALDDECTCNRNLPLMDIKTGRKDSFILTPDGKVISPYEFMIAMYDFPYFQQIGQYRILQNKIDSIEFHLSLINDKIDEQQIGDAIIKYFNEKMALEQFTLSVKISERVLDKTGKLNSIMSTLHPK